MGHSKLAEAMKSRSPPGKAARARQRAASAILASYDYNGDDRISLSELTNDVAPSEAINAAAHSEAVNQLEDVTKKASEALMNMYMSLSGANP